MKNIVSNAKPSAAAVLAGLLMAALAGVNAHAQAPSQQASTTPEETPITEENRRVGPANVEVPTPRSAHASAYDEDPKESASVSDTTRLKRHSQGDPEGAVQADDGVSVGQVREGALRGGTGLSDGSPGIDD